MEEEGVEEGVEEEVEEEGSEACRREGEKVSNIVISNII